MKRATGYCRQGAKEQEESDDAGRRSDDSYSLRRHWRSRHEILKRPSPAAVLQGVDAASEEQSSNLKKSPKKSQTLTRKSLLLQVETVFCFKNARRFVDRRIVKSRDAFDIDVLLSRGAQLGQNLKARLHDFIQMRELDAEFIRQRMDRVDTKLCTAELRPVLPDALFTSLAQEDFKPLRSSLEAVFADWL